MKNLIYTLYILIIFFTAAMPIIPSTSKIKYLSITGDTILYFIILYFLVMLIFNKKARISLFEGYKIFFKDYINIFMLLWVISMFLSVLYARDNSLAYTESIRLSSYAALFFILKYFIFDKIIYRYVLNSYMLTSAIIGIYGIYQSLVGLGILKSSKWGSVIRISSFMENPNNLGMYFVFAIFPFIILFIKEKKLKYKVLYLILSIISLINIIFSYSRNAYIGFAAGAIVLIIMFGIKYIVLTLIPFLLTYFIPGISRRVQDIWDVSQNLSRIKLWTIAVLMIHDHPVLGVGNGNYLTYYTDYLKDVQYINYNVEPMIHPHNAFLKAFSELGLLGVISFTGLLVSSFYTVIKFKNKQLDNFYKWFYTGTFVSLIAMFIMNLLDNFFSAPKVIVYYFLVIGVCEGIRIRESNETQLNL